MSSPAPSVVVREAERDELDTVADLMEASYAEFAPPDGTPEALEVFAAYREDIRDVRGRLPHSRLIVAVEGEWLLGCVTYYPSGGPGYGRGLPTAWASFRLLAVHPAARLRGIGRLLTEECLRRARDEGAPVLALHTTQMMAVARDMYERMGFERVPQYDFSPHATIDVLAYKLELT